jgi:CRP/FNR family cyclic AMP-dependent transcriptional regulator
MQRTYQFSELAPTRAEGELAQLLRREGRARQFAAGALIQAQGDDVDGFWLVEAGTVLLCRFHASGNSTVYAVLGPGDLFGELAHFAGLRRQVDAIADSQATLVRIDGVLIDRLLATTPEFARWLLKSLANQLRHALDRIEGDRQTSAHTRLVRTLADMTRRTGPRIQITQQALGDLIGTSRITTGSLLRELERDGILSLEYRQIIVTDVARLTALGG